MYFVLRFVQCFRFVHSEKSLVRSMLFYSRNCWQQNWVQFVLYINSDCMYIGDLWLQLWLKTYCKNIGSYSIFQLMLLLLLNNYQYNCNNTIFFCECRQYCLYPRLNPMSLATGIIADFRFRPTVSLRKKIDKELKQTFLKLKAPHCALCCVQFKQTLFCGKSYGNW